MQEVAATMMRQSASAPLEQHGLTDNAPKHVQNVSATVSRDSVEQSFSAAVAGLHGARNLQLARKLSARRTIDPSSPPSLLAVESRKAWETDDAS
jgi:hypothetical protein